MIISISYLKIQIPSQSYKPFGAGEFLQLPSFITPTCVSHLLAILTHITSLCVYPPFFLQCISPNFHLANYFTVPKMKRLLRPSSDP